MELVARKAAVRGMRPVSPLPESRSPAGARHSEVRGPGPAIAPRPAGQLGPCRPRLEALGCGGNTTKPGRTAASGVSRPPHLRRSIGPMAVEEAAAARRWETPLVLRFPTARRRLLIYPSKRKSRAAFPQPWRSTLRCTEIAGRSLALRFSAEIGTIQSCVHANGQRVGE